MQRQNHAKYVNMLWEKYNVLVLKVLLLVCTSACVQAVGPDMHTLREEFNDLALCTERRFPSTYTTHHC
jgi:hypothetical protein